METIDFFMGNDIEKHIKKNILDIFKNHLTMSIEEVTNVKKCIIYESGRMEEFDFTKTYGEVELNSKIETKRGLVIEVKNNKRMKKYIFLYKGDVFDVSKLKEYLFFNYDNLKTILDYEGMKKVDDLLDFINRTDIMTVSEDYRKAALKYCK